VSDELDRIAKIIVDTAFHIHEDLGPGLLEAAYEALLFEKLKKRSSHVDRQVPITVEYDGIRLDNAFKIDLLIEGKIIVELKATEKTLPVHARQVLTYLKLTNLRLGFLINFGAPTFKVGTKRLINEPSNLVSWCLGVLVRAKVKKEPQYDTCH
jgi:GxxExxY protein